MVKQQEHSVHLKTSFKKAITSRFKLHFGGEYFTTTFQEDFTRSPDENFANSLNNNILGTFIETDYYFSKKISLQSRGQMGICRTTQGSKHFSKGINSPGNPENTLNFRGLTEIFTRIRKMTF
jgi:hypothetical protein